MGALQARQDRAWRVRARLFTRLGVEGSSSCPRRREPRESTFTDGTIDCYAVGKRPRSRLGKSRRNRRISGARENSMSPMRRFESYRSKETAGQSEAARRQTTAILNEANDAIARHAQNPTVVPPRDVNFSMSAIAYNLKRKTPLR